MTTRRELLKVGAVAGGSALVAPRIALGQLCPELGDIDQLMFERPSPFAEPFKARLFIPPIAQPVPASSLVPPPNPARHQRYNEFPPQKFYVHEITQFGWPYHPDWTPSPAWGFNGITPGPTFHARYGEPVFVRRYNNLPPVNTLGFGLPSTTTHLHNAHTASESDGNPLDFIDPGQFWDHHHANFAAGFDQREILNSLWYHDHRMDFTAPNVYAGLSGFYLLFDENDSNDEQDPRPGAWRLPSGKYDVPMLLHDVLFDDNYNPLFDPFRTDGHLGDKYTVNRIVQPVLEVEPRKYRFRIQNGGPSRFYQLYLSTGQKFVILSNDGNFLERPVQADNIAISVAQRHDVIVDFSRYAPGDRIHLLNRLEQFDGSGPTGRILDGDPDVLGVMRFDVVPPSGPDFSRIPDRLRDLPPINLAEVRQQRVWAFDYDGGKWTVNGKTFDPDRIDATVKQGTAEIWTIRNDGTRWSHPVHIHFEEFQILELNGHLIPPGDVRKSRKDVLTLGPGDEAKLFFRFRDFLGRYPMHCHNVVHEDHAMMIHWAIVP